MVPSDAPVLLDVLQNPGTAGGRYHVRHGHPVVTLDWQLAACGEGGRSEALPRKGSPTVKGSPSRPGREPTGDDEGEGEDTAEDGERAVTPPTPRCRSSIVLLDRVSMDDERARRCEAEEQNPNRPCHRRRMAPTDFKMRGGGFRRCSCSARRSPTSTLATISSDDHPLPSLSTAIIRDDSIITRIV